MSHAIVFDCEFLTAEGSPSRFWCGPHDPDPVAVQIGAVKLRLGDGYPILDHLRIHVAPLNRNGERCALDPHFSALTGIAEETISADGVLLSAALATLAEFAAGAKLWSWGKDEFNMVAVSCYVANIPPPLPATRFGNACTLLLKAGVPYADIKTMRSSGLAAYYGLNHPPLRAHDALDDALSVAHAMQHLLKKGVLGSQDFA
jgi:hypothetical protein